MPIDPQTTIVAIAGNMHRPSKSRALLENIAGAVREGSGVAAQIHDMVDVGPALAGALSRADLSPQARSIVERIERADALIACVPVYKGSCPGLFKHLVDFLDQKSLLHKPVIVGASGGSLQHALVIDHQLRPLFGFFDAWTVPTGVYATDADFEGQELRSPAVRARVRQAAHQLTQLLAGRSLGNTEMEQP